MVWKKKMWKRILSFLLIGTLIGAMRTEPVQPTSAATTAQSEWVTVEQDVSASEMYDDETIDVTLDVSGIPNTAVNLPTDVILVLDCSGSMGGTKINTLKSAVTDFVEGVDYSRHRVGIVAYASDTTIADFTTDKEGLKTFVDGLTANGGTATDLGIKEAVSMMKTKKRGSAKSTIILLTDGAANNLNAALEASESAKQLVFYTIALLTDKNSINDPTSSEYGYVQMLRKMATTGDHYFYSDVSGLPHVYADIASEIGIAYPRSVEVTQTVSSQFEIVPGSADDNMPVPTISDHTITWKMPEVHETPANLSYKVRVADGAKPGTYKLTTLGKVVYKNAYGTQLSLQIPEEQITIKYHTPQISTLSTDVFDAPGGDQVTITGSNFYPTTLVYLGDTKATNIQVVSDSEIHCTMPAHAQGTFDLRVVNLDGGEAKKSVQVTATPVVNSISPAYGPYLGGNTVQIKGDYYMEGVKVYFDAKEADISVQRQNYMSIVVPFTGAEGKAVDVKIVNPDGTSLTVPGAYTYLARPTPVIKSVTPATSEVGKTQAVKIVIDNLKFGDDFKVVFGGKEITSFIYKGSNYVRFYVPTDLTAGSYDIVVQNGDGMTATAKDAYTFTGAPVPPPFPTLTLSPDSGKIGVATKVKVEAATALKYEDGFRVTVGGKDAVVNYKGSNYFRITVPTDLAAGQYDVVVYNGSNASGQVVGTYTVLPEQPIPLPSLVISPNSGDEGVATKIKVEGTTALKYADGFRVTIGGKNAVVNYKGSKYFRITAPTDLTVGQYDVVVYNGKNVTGQVVGTYNVTAVVPPTPPALSNVSMDVTTSKEGATQVVKLSADNLVYGSGFHITFGGVEAKITSKASKYVRFRVPENMLAGTYNVDVYNGDGSQATTIGTYTITKVVPPTPYGFSFSTTTSPAGNRTAVKLTATNLVYGSGFHITMGGKDVDLIYKGTKYVRFYTPTDLTAGSYDVVIYNGNGTVGTTAGTYVLS